jgi:hypothetical protein
MDVMMLAITSSFKHQADRTILSPSLSRHTAPTPTHPLSPPPHGHAHPKTLSALHATGVIIHQRTYAQHTRRCRGANLGTTEIHTNEPLSGCEVLFSRDKTVTFSAIIF